MTKTILFIIPLLLIFAFTCERIPTFPVGESFQMKIGERRSNEDAKVVLRLDGVTEDSRCPKNTNCVWEGQVKMKFTLMTADKSEKSFELNLRQDRPAEAMKALNGYTYKMNAVEPYPVSGSKIAPEDYQVTMIVVEGEAVDAGETNEQ
jgi:hypothetical protein